MRRPTNAPAGLLAVAVAVAAVLVHAAEPWPEPEWAAAAICFQRAFEARGIGAAAAGEDCLAVLARPCRAAADALGPLTGCLDAHADRFAAKASGAAGHLAPFLSPSERAQLADAVETGRARIAPACARRVAPLEEEARPLARASCRLGLAAALAHLVEFHPKRLISRPERNV
ncbi:MAG: hypothetical protein ACFBSD_15485 [Paracoccaceae bacterium]